MKSKLLILISLALSACVPVTQLSVPKDYSGPRASIESSSEFLSSSEATLYYVQNVDDRYIHNALLKAELLSSGTNSHLIVDPQLTEVTTSSIKLKLVATKVKATGASFSLDTENIYSKEIYVKLKANQNYKTKGELSSNGFRLWLEDKNTGEVFE